MRSKKRKETAEPANLRWSPARLGSGTCSSPSRREPGWASAAWRLPSPVNVPSPVLRVIRAFNSAGSSCWRDPTCSEQLLTVGASQHPGCRQAARLDAALAELCLWRVLASTCLVGVGTFLLPPPPAVNCFAGHQPGWASLAMMSVVGESSWPPQVTLSPCCLPSTCPGLCKVPSSVPGALPGDLGLLGHRGSPAPPWTWPLG